MNKREDIQIYELCYKKVPYGFWDTPLYTPLQCGADLTKEDVCELKDNTGDNISIRNDFYSETTGTYWIWKNAPKTKFVGQCQYRRRLEFSEDFDFEKAFCNADIIINQPMVMIKSLRNHMIGCHPQIDEEIFRDILKTRFPELIGSYERNFLRGGTLFNSSSYVMRWTYFDEYCDFLFTFLKLYMDMFGFDDPFRLKCYVESKLNSPNINKNKYNSVEYQSLIGGFLQERLISIWVLDRFERNKIYMKSFKYMESIY